MQEGMASHLLLAQLPRALTVSVDWDHVFHTLLHAWNLNGMDQELPGFSYERLHTPSADSGHLAHILAALYG